MTNAKKSSYGADIATVSGEPLPMLSAFKVGKTLILTLVILFFLLPLSSAVLASPSVKASSSDAKSVATAQRVAQVLSHLLAHTNITFNGYIRLINQPGANAAVVFGTPGYIQIDESYADSLSDGELTFVFSHELAHLLSDHHQRLKRFHSKKTPPLHWAGEADQTPEYLVADEISLHHELELDADLKGLSWTVKAGYTATDAANAIKRAYNGAEQAFATHPAMTARTAWLLAKP